MSMGFLNFSNRNIIFGWRLTNRTVALVRTLLAAVLVFVCYFFTPPAGAHPTNPNTPININ
jgi:hypothetical protein